eukprot:gene17895-biopygen2704
MPRRRRLNFNRQRARERQYYQNRHNNNGPPNAGEQQFAVAVNELAALELQIAQNELPDQQGNNEAEIDQQPPQQFHNIQPNQPAEQLNANQHPQPFFNLPQPHYIGIMENACHHCDGKFFNVNELPGRGPRVVTIHGQTYHLKSAADAPEGQLPQYSQLYILDTNQALQERIHDPRNANLQPDILRLLQDELMTVNPFARQFQNMGQVLERERNNAVANNQPLPPVRMIIAQRPFQDRRYDYPIATEIAAVYVGDEGAPPDPGNRDI